MSRRRLFPKVYESENDDIYTITKLKQEKADLKESLDAANIKIKQLENKIRELESKDNKNQNQFDEDSNISNNEIKGKISNNYNNNNDLKEELKKKRELEIKFENYKKNDYDEKYIGKKLEEFYDLVINIKSISSLSTEEGWPIKWNLARKDILKKNINNKRLLKIGILGNGNVGKSFILSRLFHEDIPSGYSVITEGLSLKYNDKKGYTILDSAGLQTPLINDNKNKNDMKTQYTNTETNKDNQFREYENLYRDKTQTENFIQNLILNSSDMLLIVVGKLTFNEQRLINKIKKEIEIGQKEKEKKQIFIIHNLLNFQKLNQVEDHINNTLLKSASFELIENKDIKKSEKEKKERIYYVENETKFQTYHLIMAREGTEAGDYYNRYTYEFLEEKFNNFTERKPLSIINEVKDKLILWSNDLLEEKITPQNIEIVKETDDGDLEIKYIFKPNEKDSKKLTPKACISDELGFNIYRSNGYEPPYNYYIEDDKILVVNMEIPGNVKIDDAYASLDSREIIVEGNKYDISDKIKSLKNTRKFGQFNLHIPFGNLNISDEFRIEEENNEENRNGIYVVKFRLARRRNKEKDIK